MFGRTRFKNKLKKAKELSIKKWKYEIFPLIYATSEHPCALCELFPFKKEGKCYTKKQKKVCPICENAGSCCREWMNVKKAIKALIDKLEAIEVE